MISFQNQNNQCQGLCSPGKCHTHQFTRLYFCHENHFNSYSASHDNWCTATLWNRIMTAQCEGMGEVGSARYEPALLPPCPSIRVLSYSNYQEIHSRQQTGLAVEVLIVRPQENQNTQGSACSKRYTICNVATHIYDFTIECIHSTALYILYNIQISLNWKAHNTWFIYKKYWETQGSWKLFS